MAVGNIFGYPLQSDVFFYRETSYAGGIPAGTSGVTMWVSDVVQNARVDVAETVKAMRGISEPSITGWTSTTSDYTLHLEFPAQYIANTSLPSFCINRVSSVSFGCNIAPLCFVLVANECAGKTVAALKSYYLLKGVVCKNINLKGSTNDNYLWSADFSVASMTITNTAPSRFALPTVLTAANTYAMFNKPGAIVRQNSTATIAYIVDGIDVTINNHITDIWNNASQYKQNAIAGAMDVTGTAQITLDKGGQNQYAKLYTALTNVLIDMNNTSYDVLTLSDAKWDGYTAEMNTGDTPMMTPAKFIAKKAALAT